MRGLFVALALSVGCSAPPSTAPPVAIPVASVRASPTEVLPSPPPPEPSGAVKAAISQAHVDCVVIHVVAEKWRADHPGECPSVTRLKDDRELSASSKLQDPWGQLYEIRCGEDDTYISSAGPNGTPGDGDDVRFPE